MMEYMTTRGKVTLAATVLFLAYCNGMFGWLMAAAVVVGLGWLAYQGWLRTVDGLIAERRRHEEIAVRADLQNAQYLNGDPRGIYGR